MKPYILAVALATLPAVCQVTNERLLNAVAEPANWLTYSGAYNSQRHSSLAEINRSNVSRLRVAWIYQAGNGQRTFQATPLVVDGVMYISEPAKVSALDARTGRPLWTFNRPLPETVITCCGLVNRGVAILGNSVFVGTMDAHVLALDIRTGRMRWDTVVADHLLGYSVSAAPLIVEDKVVVGVGGGEFGIRGFLDAYDAATGKRVWRTYTIPGDGEKGNESWSGDSWKTGGGPTWVTGTYDPELKLIYWGIGNPGPLFTGKSRRGDNLYTCSLLALDAATGKYRWHFQFTPHDEHDWDANQVPILIDRGEGEPRKLVVTANRNGFYYVLDRVTGRFLRARSFVKQNWASEIDAKGRPVPSATFSPSLRGTAIYPGAEGGTNWQSPTYSPRTGTFYVTTREEGMLYFQRDDRPYRPGQFFMRGSHITIPGEKPHGSVLALDAWTGEKRWEFPLLTTSWAGLLSTAGDLIFGGTGNEEGNFFALDATSGKPLWQIATGGEVRAAPITYQVAGKQHVAVAAGRNLMIFSLP
jgi:alcohol dehydrogenase (cytochrome c)